MWMWIEVRVGFVVLVFLGVQAGVGVGQQGLAGTMVIALCSCAVYSVVSHSAVPAAERKD